MCGLWHNEIYQKGASGEWQMKGEVGDDMTPFDFNMNYGILGHDIFTFGYNLFYVLIL
jgi:hypothetical protein